MPVEPDPYRNVTVRSEEGVTRLVLSRPPLNILNTEMMEEIAEAIVAIGADGDVKAMAIEG